MKTRLRSILFVCWLICAHAFAQTNHAPIKPPVITTPPGSAKIEQTAQGTQPAATVVASFDGLGAGFKGPQGTATLRNPSDSSLAVVLDPHTWTLMEARFRKR